MNIFITTQMRVGSTWVCDLVSEMLGTRWVFWERGRDIPKERFKKEIEAEPRKGFHVFKMHFTPPKRICECIKPGDKNNFVISITRDILDTAVSKILYLRRDKPMKVLQRLKDLEDMRKQFGNHKLGDKRYINLFIKTPHFKHIVKNWKLYNDGYEHPNYMLFTYELLHRRRLFVMKNISNFIGVKRNNKQLRQVIVRNNFQSTSGRKPGEEDNRAFRRKGIVGDYKNYINKENIDYIMKLVKDDNI